MNGFLSQHGISAETAPAIAFALLTLIFGAIIAFEDNRTGKIRNKLIITAILCGSVLHAVFAAVFAFFFKDYSVRPEYFLSIITNSIIALAVGFFLWKVKVWSAGDAKMFAMFAFLIPLYFYEKSSLPIFPSFNLLINIFAVSVIIVAVQAVAGSAAHAKDSRDKNGAAKNSFGSLFKNARDNAAANWPVFVIMFFLFNIFYIAMAKLRQHTGRELDFILNIAYIVLMFTVIGWISGAIRKKMEKYKSLKALTVALIIGVVAISIAAPSHSDLIIRNGRNVAGYMIFVGLLRRLLEVYFEKKDVRRIKASELQPGHIPAADINIETGSGEKTDIGTVFVDGLSSEQVSKLKGNLAPDAEVEIVEPVAFAPMALAGVVITLLLRQSVIHYIIMMAKK